MWSVKCYRFGFDPWGLGLFLLIMLPNLAWFALPAPNDVLRVKSAAPLLDGLGQCLQIIMVVALCLVVNVSRGRPIKRGFAAGAALCATLYFAGWAGYYVGTASAGVILTLCLAPCGAFLLFSLARGNAPALLAAAGFALCHLGSTIITFIL